MLTRGAPPAQNIYGEKREAPEVGLLRCVVKGALSVAVVNVLRVRVTHQISTLNIGRFGIDCLYRDKNVYPERSAFFNHSFEEVSLKITITMFLSSDIVDKRLN